MNAKDLSIFIVYPDTSIIESMKRIDLNSNEIVFIVNENKQLLGSLTDGDIRRWILSGKSINDISIKAANQSPIKVNATMDVDCTKSIMIEKKIKCIPIVNDDNVIIDLVFWNDIIGNDVIRIKKSKIDLPVVIMAGGIGDRLKPFTQVLPKALIPIGEKTIIEKIIDKFIDYQISDFYVSVNHKAKIIKSYLENLELNLNISFIEEPIPLGTAGSLRFLSGKINNDFILTNCDIIIYSNYSEIVKFHRDFEYDITLVSSMMNFQVPYGICEIDVGGRLLKITEKPEYNFLISTGMYVINSKILKYIPENKIFHITDLMDSVKKNNGKIGVFPISDKSWVDTGQWKEYKKTIERFDKELL